jgi:DNA-binding FadR family transcriptional regulator
LYERDRERFAGDAERFTDADIELHQAILRASGNVLASAAWGMAARALWPDLLARARSLAADQRLDDLHRELVDAVEAGHETTARRAARLITAIEEHALQNEASL